LENLKNKVKALIFDLSGTLIDDWAEVLETNKMIAEKRGIKLTEEVFRKSYKINWREFWQSQGVKCDRELIEEWKKIFRKLIKKRTKPLFYKGAIKFLKKARKKYHIAVVTTALRDTFNAYLEVEKIPKDYFEIVVTGDDIRRMKPEPDQICLACQRLRVKPEESVMIGDTEEDVIAGRKAGCRTIKVSWGYPERENEKEKADFLISSWEELEKLLL
jgi:HAD superfamily hydrolase (TIGR01509 family)